MKFELKAKDKRVLKNEEWHVQREVERQISVTGEEEYISMGQAIFTGRQDFRTTLNTLATQYMADMWPHLINDPTYYALKVGFNLEEPLDTGLRIAYAQGTIDVLDKKCVNVLRVTNNEIRVDPVFPGSKLYFNTVIRRSPSRMSAASMIDTQIILTAWKMYLKGLAFKNDTFKPGITNAMLMRALEILIRDLKERQYDTKALESIMDPTKLSAVAEAGQKFLSDTMQKYRNRKYLGFGALVHRAGPVQYWSEQDVIEVYIQRLLTDLPIRNWYNTYLLDKSVGYCKEDSKTIYREAIGTAPGKFSLNIIPDICIDNTYAPPSQFGYKPADIVGVGFHTNAPVVDFSITNFFKGKPDGVKNMTDNRGRYQPVAADKNPSFIKKGGPVATYLVGQEGDVANLQPVLDRINVIASKGVGKVEGKLVLEPYIVGQEHALLRIIAAVDDTKPCIVTLGENESQRRSCLIMPDMGMPMNVIPYINNIKLLVAKKEGCDFKGMMSRQYAEQLSELYSEGFQLEDSIQTGMETDSLTGLLGI